MKENLMDGVTSQENQYPRESQGAVITDADQEKRIRCLKI